MKKQAEKQEQQRAGKTQAQPEGRGLEVVNVNGAGSAQASPMSVNSALGVGEDDQGAMEVESSNVENCKADVEIVPPPTVTVTTTTMTTTTTTTTTITTIAAPVAKLELDGYHGPPLLLPQTREAKQEVIEGPLSGLSGPKYLISAPSTLSNVETFWSVRYPLWVRI